MNKMIFASAAVATLAVGATGFAQENWSDKGGGFGLGVDTTYGFGQAGTGISGRYFINNDFGLNFGLGGNYGSESQGDHHSASLTTLDLSLGLEYRILKSQRANLNAFGGLSFRYLSTSTEVGGTTTSDSATDIAGALGLRGEVWLTNFFSIHGRVGLDIDYDGEDLAGDDSSEMNIGIFRGALVGGFGFTFWFK